MTPRCSKRHLPHLLLAAVIASLTTAGASARAQPSDEAAIAAQLFRAAAAAFERRDYAAAARTFEESNEHVPRPAATYNAGLAWEEAGEKARAADAYTAALVHPGLSERDASVARKRLDALTPELGRARVATPAGGSVSIAHAEGRRLPAEIHLAPGAYQARVAWPTGGTVVFPLRVGAGQVVVVEPPSPPASAASPAARDAGPRAEAPSPSPSPPPRLSDVRKTWGWLSLGGAVVFSGAAVGLGVGTLDARNDFVASGEHSVSDHDRATTLRTLTNVAWTTAAVSAVVGVVLVLASPSTAKRVSADSRYYRPEADDIRPTTLW